MPGMPRGPRQALSSSTAHAGAANSKRIAAALVRVLPDAAAMGSISHRTLQKYRVGTPCCAQQHLPSLCCLKRSACLW